MAKKAKGQDKGVKVKTSGKTARARTMHKAHPRTERPKGRPSSCTPEVSEAVIKAITLGTPIYVACEVAGISKATYNNWRNRGEAELERLEENEDAEIDPDERPFVDFFVGLKRAEAYSHQLAVERINAIAKDIETTDARVRLEADKFLLERRFKDDWGRNERIHQTVDGGVELKLNLPEPNSGKEIDGGEVIDLEYIDNHPLAQVIDEDDDAPMDPDDLAIDVDVADDDSEVYDD